ncbi:MAG: methionyl-tRNA formyltransferase [Alloprevotella sp.]|nr:methionyl-tRNA formyltransferase [Bacteroidales bacterium]MDY2606048.1 methionyl-tRNA formyltransferase [Alloprevotella sp.]MCI6104232.1 methionyl-tRNA formyltransferase [Bacteroidales bacterium]MCI6251782.1 methionyl-tRNA formyltransferase [Bacteroidales bacterium]MDY5086529.1 methionyl-tRNA formyltransferase [Alloprevotella sp.]
MTKESLRIVYMGTPDFAVETLDRLVSGGYNVVGVVTMPDKPVGRHQTTLQASPVKRYALEHGLPLLQPERLRDEAFLQALADMRPDLGVVVAFRMLPEVVWAMPRLGTFNLHAALLPQYRGAAPINWAIINGDTETGVTTFFLDHDIDTGRVIHRRSVPIADTDTAEDVHDRLMHLGADLVCATIDDIIADRVTPIPQDQLTTDGPLRPAPKLFKDNCRITWTDGTKRCYDFIRGLSPYPAAWTTLVDEGGKAVVMKIYVAHKDFSPVAEAPGTVLVADGEMRIVLADGTLVIDSLQMAGKKRMATADFLRGFHPQGLLHVE